MGSPRLEEWHYLFRVMFPRKAPNPRDYSQLTLIKMFFSRGIVREGYRAYIFHYHYWKDWEMKGFSVPCQHSRCGSLAFCWPLARSLVQLRSVPTFFHHSGPRHSSRVPVVTLSYTQTMPSTPSYFQSLTTTRRDFLGIATPRSDSVGRWV